MNIIPFPTLPVGARVRIIHVLQAVVGAQSLVQMDNSMAPWATIADAVLLGLASRRPLDEIETRARKTARNLGFDDATIDVESGVYHVGIFTDVDSNCVNVVAD